MKTYKKHFLIVLKKFWKLKIIAFLKWLQNLNIQRLLQKCIEIFEADLKKQQQRQQKIRFQRNKKVPAIQPFLVNDKFVSDFCKRTDLFNNIFASICTSIKSSSIFPCGKVKHEFSYTSYKSKFKSYEFKSTGYMFESTSYEFESTSYEFEPSSYELISTRCKLETMSN